MNQVMDETELATSWSFLKLGAGHIILLCYSA